MKIGFPVDKSTRSPPSPCRFPPNLPFPLLLLASAHPFWLACRLVLEHFGSVLDHTRSIWDRIVHCRRTKPETQIIFSNALAPMRTRNASRGFQNPEFAGQGTILPRMEFTGAPACMADAAQATRLKDHPCCNRILDAFFKRYTCPNYLHSRCLCHRLPPCRVKRDPVGVFNTHSKGLIICRS